LFSPSATSLGLATLEPEVPRLLVEGRANVGWPRPPFTHGKTASAHIANIVVKPGVDCRLAAAVAPHLGVDEPAQESPASRKQRRQVRV
jgi:hypothetical protein